MPHGRRGRRGPAGATDRGCARSSRRGSDHGCGREPVGRGRVPSYNSSARKVNRRRSMARPKPPAPTLVSADDIELEFYEALQRGDIERLMAPVVRRRRDLLRPPGRRAPGRRGGDPRLVRGDVRATARSTPSRERVRRLESHSSAVHSVLERIRVMTTEGEQFAWVVATNVYLQVVAGLAPGRAPRQPGQRASEVQDDRRGGVDPALTPRVAMNDFRAPRWLPGGHVQTIWPALFSRRFDGAAAGASGASAGRRPTAISSTSTGSATSAGRLRRCSSSSTASRARRRATTRRPSPPRRSGAAGASPCRTFAAARARSTSRRAPTTRATTRRSAGCWRAFAPLHAGPIVAVGVSLGGNALLRWAEEAGASAAATRARGRRGLGAARPRRRRPRDRPRLQPPGLHAHVPAHDEAQGAASSWRQHPGLFDRERAARGARPVRLRQRLHRAAARLSRHRRLLGARLGQAAPGPHPHPGAGAQRAQRSVRAGARPAAAAARSGRTSRCGSRRTAATSAFPPGAGRATC